MATTTRAPPRSSPLARGRRERRLAPATTGSAGAGDSEVVVGAVLEPTSLNLITQAGAALDQVLLDNVYETLLTATAEGDVEGGLTDLPEISDDGLTYTFTIPEGVTFHSGAPLMAADVVWSLGRAAG